MELIRNVQIKSSVIQHTCYGWKLRVCLLQSLNLRGEDALAWRISLILLTTGIYSCPVQCVISFTISTL